MHTFTDSTWFSAVFIAALQTAESVFFLFTESRLGDAGLRAAAAFVNQ
jgi:hypothetical protein